MKQQLSFRFSFLFLIACVLQLGGTPLQAQPDNPEDPMRGFMGFTLGEAREDLDVAKLQKRGKYQKLIRWDVISEHLQFEDIALKQVKLFFWEGKLHSIEVKAQTEAGQQLREWTENTFGEGHKEDAMGYSFSWEGNSSLVFMEQNLVTKDVMVTFRDDEVHNSYYKFMYQRTYGQ